MSSESSLVTTAASSDTSSSADSRYCSGRSRPSSNCVQFPSYVTREAAAASIPPQWNYYYASPDAVQSTSPTTAVAPSPGRRRNYNLKARGVVIAKGGAASPSTGPNQKVFCVCKSCNGQRMVSKSTCYRHLRLEADQIELEDEYHHDKWDHARWGGARENIVTPLSSHQVEAASRMHVAVATHHLPSIPTSFQF